MNQTIFERGLKKVYISGPITGIEELNIPAFKKAEEKLRSLNFEPINPHELFSEEELNEANKKLERKEWTKEDYWAYFMKRDVEYLTRCEFVAVLPYWETSRGANLELAIAKALRMPIIQVDNLQEITQNVNFSINKFQKL